jgi:hypothetical protein
MYAAFGTVPHGRSSWLETRGRRHITGCASAENH